MIFQSFACHRPLEQHADDLLRDLTHGHGPLPGHWPLLTADQLSPAPARRPVVNPDLV